MATEAAQQQRLRKSPATDGVLAGQWIALTSLVLTPIALLALSSGASLSSDALPFLMLVALSSWRLVRSVPHGWPRLHEQVFWLFIYVWLGLAPLLQVATGVHPLPFPVDGGDYARAGWIAMVGVLSYLVALDFRATGPASLRTPGARRELRDPRAIRLIAGAALATTLAVVFYLGPSSFVHSRQELSAVLFARGRADNSRGAIFSAMASVPIFVALIAMILQRKHVHAPAFLDRLLLLLLVIANAFVNNPISQSRFWFTTVWGSVAILALWGRAAVVAWFPVSAIAVLLLVFPVSAVFRYASEADRVVHWQEPWVSLAQSGDFDAAEQIAWGVKITDSTDFAFGRQALGAAAFAIPRSYWHEKPLDTGIELALHASYPNTSLSAPLWVEGYVDGGLILGAAYLGLLGAVHRRLRSSYSGDLPGLAVIFILYQLVLLRGSLIATMAVSASLLACGITLTKRIR